jgi:hypothetical protein
MPPIARAEQRVEERAAPVASAGANGFGGVATLVEREREVVAGDARHLGARSVGRLRDRVGGVQPVRIQRRVDEHRLLEPGRAEREIPVVVPAELAKAADAVENARATNRLPVDTAVLPGTSEKPTESRKPIADCASMRSNARRCFMTSTGAPSPSTSDTAE